MFYKSILLATVLVATAACEKKDIKASYLDENKTETTVNSSNGNATTPSTGNAAAVNVTSQNGQPVQINPGAVTSGSSSPASTTATAAKTAPGMNPPHGEPGHRCDIPVGSSLSQPVQNTPTSSAPSAITPSAPTQIIPQQTNNTVPQAVAPGTNPPHGQPGHRCDIPVGAPLK